MFGLLGLIKGVAVVCSMAFALPVGGVYASADSPSKYLDRLTTVNTSVNRESNDVSPGVEDEPTVSHAVRTSHGVILNTVVRNANRLEYVDDDPEITSDDRVEPVHKTVTRSAASVNSILPDNGPSGDVTKPFTGESTITYDANGGYYGNDTSKTVNQVGLTFNDYTRVTSHTMNLNDYGAGSNGYGDNQNLNQVITIPGAEQLTMTITYQTQSVGLVSYDWACAWEGNHPEYRANKNWSTSLTGKLGGKDKTTKTFIITGDTVTIGFKSDSSNSNYYGYYATIQSSTSAVTATYGEYQAPVNPDDDYVFNGWNTKQDGSGYDLGSGEIVSTSPITIYAQWRLNYQKWETIGWRITTDGVLKIRPWEGDTGTTGSSIRTYNVPWYNQRTQIKKVESTGNIILNAKSYYLFDGCSNLVSLDGLQDWDVSKVSGMYSMFSGCSSLTDLTALKDWNVSNVTDMLGMFNGCSSLTSLEALQGWNVSNVTDMGSMFYNCSSLTSLEALQGWDVSKVTGMDRMFNGCSSLTSLEALQGWNVSNVTRMEKMFNGCSSLTSLEALQGWNVSNVTRMDNMFDGCSSLTSLEALQGWNVSNVTRMDNMFNGCSSLIDASSIKDWNLNNVTNMNSMFSGCSSLQKVGIPSIANGGQKLVENASTNGLSGSLNSRIITEDLQLGPYTWDGLNTEMTTNPEGFTEGHVWVRYIPSWRVTYDGNGGVGSMPGSMVSVSSPLTLPEASFLRFGYKFIGWTTQPDSVSATNPLMKSGQIFDPSDKTEGQEYTLHAQWEKIGGSEEQPVTGQSGSLPGWAQVDSENTRNDITPNQSQAVIFTNKYDPGLTSIQFKFTKLMDGNVPDAGESFQFELLDATQNKIKVIQTTTNTGAAVQFKPITYDKAGTYKYYVRETPSNVSTGTNSNPNLDYDDHLVEVVVTVTEDDPTSPSGKKLTATAQITGDTTFRNDSKPASLDISKDVTGVTEGMNGNHRDREFTFNVNLLDRDNQPVSGKTYPTTITNNSESSESNGDDSSSTSSITFDSEGNATIGLRAGSKLTINGIPAYYKYTITETNIPAGYENTSLTNSSGILGANSHVTVDAVNHYTATPANASLQAGKTLLAPGGLNQSVNNGEFRFSLCQVTPLPIGPESGPNAESCTGVSEASNDGNGLVTFPQLTYDAPGTYRYQIREVKGDALGMKYDSTVYTVTVKVTDDGEGRLVAAITYRNNTTGATSSPGLKPVWDPSDPGAMGVPVFVNRTTVANRLPVTGGRDIIIASVILALVLAGGLFVFLRRNREE